MNKTIITIGRNPASDIRVDESFDTVSNSHADISFDGTTLTYSDHSSNGTTINGQRFRAAAMVIQPGCDITLGDNYHVNWEDIYQHFPTARPRAKTVHPATVMPRMTQPAMGPVPPQQRPTQQMEPGMQPQQHPTQQMGPATQPQQRMTQQMNGGAPQQQQRMTQQMSGGAPQQQQRMTQQMSGGAPQQQRMTQQMSGQAQPAADSQRQHRHRDKATNTEQTPAYTQAELQKAQQKWSWAAFLGTYVWALRHKKFWPLILLPLLFVPFISPMALLLISVHLGLTGAKTAWRSGVYKSYKSYKRAQTLWAIAGVLIFAINCAIIAAATYYTLSRINFLDFTI